LAVRKRWKKFWQSPRRFFDFLRLVNLIRKKRIDLIYANTLQSFLTVRDAILWTKVRSIAMIRGPWELIEKKNIEKVIDTADLIFLTSNWLKERIKIPERKVRILRLGVNREKLLNGRRGKIRREIGVPEGKPLIGCIGRISPEKGQHILIWALYLLKKKGKDFASIIVGDSSLSARPSYIEEIVRLRQRLGMEDRIFLMGFRKDIENVYMDIDIVTIPSLFETVSRVLQEAFVCGKATIAPRVKPLEEIAEEGENILFFEPGNPIDLSQKIELLLDLPQVRRRLGEEARKKMDEFDSEKYTIQIENILEEITSKGR